MSTTAVVARRSSPESDVQPEVLSDCSTIVSDVNGSGSLGFSETCGSEAGAPGTPSEAVGAGFSSEAGGPDTGSEACGASVGSELAGADTGSGACAVESGSEASGTTGKYISKCLLTKSTTCALSSGPVSSVSRWGQPHLIAALTKAKYTPRIVVLNTSLNCSCSRGHPRLSSATNACLRTV